jgi:hypothetical protein
MDLHEIRKWVNRDDGKLQRVGNHNVNAFEIIGCLLFIAGTLFMRVNILSDFKSYGWFLFVAGILLFVYGGLKSNMA